MPDFDSDELAGWASSEYLQDGDIFMFVDISVAEPMGGFKRCIICPTTSRNSSIDLSEDEVKELCSHKLLTTRMLNYNALDIGVMKFTVLPDDAEITEDVLIPM